MTFEERQLLKAAIDAAVRADVFTMACPGCGLRIPRSNGRVYCSHACGARHYARRQREAAA